jgi:hypothetical protein
VRLVEQHPKSKLAVFRKQGIQPIFIQYIIIIIYSEHANINATGCPRRPTNLLGLSTTTLCDTTAVGLNSPTVLLQKNQIPPTACTLRDAEAWSSKELFPHSALLFKSSAAFLKQIVVG